jgi:hypothetical protein
MVRILICGDVRGQLKKLCDAVTKLNAKTPPAQQFQAVFCVGEFSAEEMDLDVSPPIPVHFIDCGPATKDLIESSPQGDELASNLHFLGHYGIAKVAGLSVAYLSGRHRADLFDPVGDDCDGAEGDDSAAPQETLSDLKSKYAAESGDGSLLARLEPLRGEISTDASNGGPSWESLKAVEKVKEKHRAELFVDGCYTPLAIERLQEEIADVGGVDMLLTCEWPAGIMKGLKEAWPEEMAFRKLLRSAAKQCASVAVAEVAAAAEPKYHIAGLGGLFWRRDPWKHERRGEVVQSTGELRCGACRMVMLGAIDGSSPGVVKKAPQAAGAERPASMALVDAVKAKPQKWLHGLDLEPDKLSVEVENATPSPWSTKHQATAEGSGSTPKESGSCYVAGSAGADLLRADFQTEDQEERRRWMKRFGINPGEMQQASDKIAKEMAPKEKKEKHKSLYKVSDKEKKRRKTGGDGHLPFHAKERMAAKG